MTSNCSIRQPKNQGNIQLREIQSCNLDLPEQQKIQTYEECINRWKDWTSIQCDTINTITNRMEEQSTKQEQSTTERCWLLMNILFTFCIPPLLKKHLQKRIQVIAGVAFFICLIIGYIALYMFYGRVEEQVFLTIEKPNKYQQCNSTLLPNTGRYVLSHDLKWIGGDLDTRLLAQGDMHDEFHKSSYESWGIVFFQYEASPEKFEQDMSSFITNVSEFVSTLDNQSYFYEKWETLYNVTFDNFVRLLFYNQRINGSEGIAFLNSNFNLEIFEYMDLDSVGGYTFNFTNIEDFQGNFNFFAAFYCGLNCIQSFSLEYQTLSQSGESGEIIKDTIKFENFQLSSYINLNQTKNLIHKYSNIDPDNLSEFELQSATDQIVSDIKRASLNIEFDFTQLFIFHYCYLIGVENCLPDKGYGFNWQTMLLTSNRSLDFYDLVLFRDIVPENLMYLHKCNLLDTSTQIANSKWFAIYQGYITHSIDLGVGPFMAFPLDVYAVPFIYWEPSIQKLAVILHFFAQENSDMVPAFVKNSLLKQNLQLLNNLEYFNSYIGSVRYDFSLFQNDYFEKLISNSLFVENFYNISRTRPPFTLTTKVYSCKVQNTPTILERLANTHATGELISIALIILLIIIFILFILPKLGTQQQNVFDQLSDAIMALFEKVAEASAEKISF